MQLINGLDSKTATIALDVPPYQSLQRVQKNDILPSQSTFIACILPPFKAILIYLIFIKGQLLECGVGWCGLPDTHKPSHTVDLVAPSCLKQLPSASLADWSNMIDITAVHFNNHRNDRNIQKSPTKSDLICM